MTTLEMGLQANVMEREGDELDVEQLVLTIANDDDN